MLKKILIFALLFTFLLYPGKRVDIIYKKSLVEVKAKGIVVSPAKKNEVVKVKNYSSGKIIIGRVIDEKTVKVD